MHGNIKMQCNHEHFITRISRLFDKQSKNLPLIWDVGES